MIWGYHYFWTHPFGLVNEYISLPIPRYDDDIWVKDMQQRELSIAMSDFLTVSGVFFWIRESRNHPESAFKFRVLDFLVNEL